MKASRTVLSILSMRILFKGSYRRKSVSSSSAVTSTLFARSLMSVAGNMRAAKAHGTKTGNAIGRPRRVFDRAEVVRLRAAGLSFGNIARQMSIGVGTVVRVLKAVGMTSPSR